MRIADHPACSPFHWQAREFKVPKRPHRSIPQPRKRLRALTSAIEDAEEMFNQALGNLEVFVQCTKSARDASRAMGLLGVMKERVDVGATGC